MKIAVIPARGGSKRIPGKNIRFFCGRPIIAYSIRAARESELFDHIVVSTDDQEIAAVAADHGAEVPFIRPATLSDDFTGTNPVVAHAIDWFQKQGGAVEFACCIYATAPFVDAQCLATGYERLRNTDKLFAFTATTFAFPIQRALKLTIDGGCEPFFPADILRRSQDLVEAYHDAGQVYWGRSLAFLNDEPLFSEHSLPIIQPRHLVQDIDTPEDWIRAELMYRSWNESAKQVR